MTRKQHSLFRNILLLLLVFLLGTTAMVDAYSVGDVDHRALRGVWRLTSLDDEGLPFERGHNQRRGRGRGGAAFLPPHLSSSSNSNKDHPETVWKLRVPMKEFTTYPKTTKMMDDIADAVPRKQTEIFIKLKDDHTFEQCTALQFSDGNGIDDEAEGGSSSLEDALELELSKRERESFAWKGTWDFVDGKLILAADRPEKRPFSAYDDYDDDDDVYGKGEGGGGSGGVSGVEKDTILVGRVAVQSEESLTENPALRSRTTTSDHHGEDAQDGDNNNDRADDDASSSSSSSKGPLKKGTIDIHLSVPKGKIKTGKFMYPKDHPEFFEQPIVRPQSKGRFELRQILGDHNARLADDGEQVELFRKKDLAGKRFYLSTFPIPKRRKKFERWDVREGKYVKEEYGPTAEERKDEEIQPGKNMQVMAIELFQNNTFSTLLGLGSSMVLRGKWSIIGEKRDQLWMMVYRFGFGRSVSGSTFSEGSSLTQNDEKGYWGHITEVDDGSHDDGTEDDDDDPSSSSSQCGRKKINIDGAVMVGWGLEPCSVGRFKMIEIEDVLEEDENTDDDDEDDEYEEMSADEVLENANSLDSMLGTNEPDTEEGAASDPFDLPGAFE